MSFVLQTLALVRLERNHCITFQGEAPELLCLYIYYYRNKQLLHQHNEWAKKMFMSCVYEMKPTSGLALQQQPATSSVKSNLAWLLVANSRTKLWRQPGGKWLPAQRVWVGVFLMLKMISFCSDIHYCYNLLHGGIGRKKDRWDKNIIIYILSSLLAIKALSLTEQKVVCLWCSGVNEHTGSARPSYHCPIYVSACTCAWERVGWHSLGTGFTL